MKKHLAILAISAFVVLAEGTLEPGLRVKYGAFFNVSLTVKEAKAAGWCYTRRPCTPTTHLPELTMYCALGKRLCAFYDDNGRVSGLQVSVYTLSWSRDDWSTGATAFAKRGLHFLQLPIPKAEIKNNVYGWENRGFQLWRTRLDDKCVEMYSTQQYFVSAEWLQKSKEERLALTDPSRLLQEEAIWITGFNRELKKLSNDEDIVSQGFTKQACLPTMGQHFIYKMTSKTACVDENFLPWFVMTMNGKLVTSAFNNFGSLPLGTPTDYMERPDLPYVKDKIVPYGSECFYDLVESSGLITMHIYYTSTPLLVTC